MDPLPLLENSLSMVKEKALKKHIQISADLKNIPDVIHADERRFKQILYNLTSNSVKFTPEGGWIRLEAGIIDERSLANMNGAEHLVRDLMKYHGQLMHVAVEDSGVGLKAKYLEKIFEPFEQIKSNHENGLGGTGLGLPLTKDLVELHGRIIWCANSQIMRLQN